jgi:hypothetical protein
MHYQLTTKRNITWITGAALLVIAVLFFWLRDNQELPSTANQRSSAPAIKVITEPVTITPNNRVYEGIGTGRARLSVRLFPEVAEEVTEVHVNYHAP